MNLSEAWAAKIDPSNITRKKLTPVSVKLSDEHHFTPEEWQGILAKRKSGEISLED